MWKTSESEYFLNLLVHTQQQRRKKTFRLNYRDLHKIFQIFPPFSSPSPSQLCLCSCLAPLSLAYFFTLMGKQSRHSVLGVTALGKGKTESCEWLKDAQEIRHDKTRSLGFLEEDSTHEYSWIWIEMASTHINKNIQTCAAL